MTEVVAALIWEKDRFMICQRPAHKARVTTPEAMDVVRMVLTGKVSRELVPPSSTVTILLSELVHLVTDFAFPDDSRSEEHTSELQSH